MDFWGLAWILWGVIGLTIEIVALRNDMEGTLSRHLRRWFHVNTHYGRTAWLVFSCLFFVAWFIPHIAHGAL